MLKYLCGFYIENLMYIRFHRKQRVVPQFYGFIFGYGITYKEYKYENSVTDEEKIHKKDDRGNYNKDEISRNEET